VADIDPSTLPEGRTLDIPESTRILLRPHWFRPIDIPLEDVQGGHGGGDERMLKALLGPPADDPLGHAASYIDGAYSILTGIAANRSFETGLPVNIRELVTI
jgi:hypothetical protein